MIKFDNFLLILQNNIRVLLFSIVLAVFYGAGAIFILAWNASIMGFAIGNVARETLGLGYLPMIFTKYLIHGIPEMLAYFIAALAGGIIYVIILRADMDKKKLKTAILDLLIIVSISIFMLVIAGLIETYISPII